MSASAREICPEMLIIILEKGVFCDAVLHEYLDEQPAFDSKERAFLSALVTGTVERCIELDYVINSFSKKNVDKLKPYIRNILRMSVYQILYMDKVPDSAAVNEAVKLVSKNGYGGLKGYINGVLRNISRNKENIIYPDYKDETVKHISVKYSMPEWIVRRYMEEMSVEELINTMEYYLSGTETIIRLTHKGMTLKELLSGFDEAGVRYSKGNIFDYAYRLSAAGRIEELPGYEEGAFVVQDESSMIPGHIATEWIKGKESSSILVMDMCAAPGGKTLHIAGSYPDRVSVEAYDISEYKVYMIRDNASRIGLGNVTANVADAFCYKEDFARKYNIVVADVPCSGLGVLAKKPDIKYNVRDDIVPLLVENQQKILNNAAGYTAPGGLLIFSTCTLNKMENELNAEQFLKNNPEFVKCDICGICRDNMPDMLKNSVTEDGYVKIIPGNVQSDGFFVAVFQKKG